MSHSHTRPEILSFLVLFLLAGCTAELGGAEGEESGAAPSADETAQSGEVATELPGQQGTLGISRGSVKTACDERGGELGVGVTKLRRLSVLEFNNTVQSLLGGPYVDYAADLPDDEPMGPFVSNQTLSVGAQEARQYLTVAEIVADTALLGATTFLPCATPVGTETACVEQFITAVLPRAFRRPLEPGEKESFLDLYLLGRDGMSSGSPDVQNGLGLLLRGIFGSPDLLYIVDTGVSGTPQDTPETVAAFTLASRLALAFWNAPPDDELVALATSGELLSDAIYSAQVERVLADPRAEAAVAQFFAELTGVNELPHKEKNTDLFPQYTAQLVTEMQSEQAAFVTNVVFAQDGLWSTLLMTNHTAPGPSLAGLYGVSSTAPVTLPATERRGLFTQAAYLAAHNKPDETSPVHLGINIREAILCETMPPPPPGVDTTLPVVSGEVRTSRDRFLLHETGPCKGCHELIDPIGLAFEHFDAIGAYRETDNGAPIDPTGQIIDSDSGDAGPPFTGALELSAQLADSVQVRDCISRQVLRAALDRQESLFDACTALSVVEGFDASGGNVRTLLSAIAHTEAFKNIALNPPQELSP